MIAWLLTNTLAKLAYLLVGLWLANGVRKALFKPRLKLISVSKSKAGTFVEVERQQLLPPWLVFKETWFHSLDVYGDSRFRRETDGVSLDADRFGPVQLERQLAYLLAMNLAREAETDELLKEERRASS